MTGVEARVEAARALAIEGAEAIRARGRIRFSPPEPSGRSFRRHVAIGDPQTSLARFLRILAHHDLLGDDGRLRQEVTLLSAGDHFDYAGEPAAVAEDGFRLILWLAKHPPDQVVMLAGNHDLSRVMELWRASDAGFARARALASEIAEIEARRPIRGEGERRLAALRRRFAARHPDVPVASLAARDYSSFTESQRSLVQQMLLAGRFRLAQAAATEDGRPILITHASLTRRDLALLGVPRERDPRPLADLLNAALAAAVDAVREDWIAGRPAPLDLSPLHVAGRGGREGGGLLYQRPANPGSGQGDQTGKYDSAAPRRYDARDLPLGLLQACGHAGHRRTRDVLGDWAAASARGVKRGGLRTLRTDGRRASYEMGIHEVPPAEAGLYMIDAEMNHVPPEDYPILELGRWL